MSCGRRHVGEHRLGQSRSTGQQSGALCGIRAQEGDLEQLAHYSEPEAPLQLATTCCQDGELALGGPLAKVIEQD